MPLAACQMSIIRQVGADNTMKPKKLVTILVYAFIGWALCAATMGIGMATMSLQSALVVHAIGAPLFFAIVSLSYFRKFSYTAPLQTALIFVGFVAAVDFFVIALLVNRSLEMFASLLGTWMPTFTLKGNLVYFAAFNKHIGFYPVPTGIEKFKKELSVYKGAKGSVQFPLDQPMPFDLISKIVKFRVKENLARAATKGKKK